MLRSLYSGVSGMKNHQIRMDVIANNIANVNTAGFKSSDVIFKDVYSQTLTPANAPNPPGVGGVNPSQVGLGMTIGAISVNFSGVTGVYRTEAPLDVAIEGAGFFTVQDQNGKEMYTRVGNFFCDAAGYLVTTEGYLVLDDQGAAIQVDLESTGGAKIEKLSIKQNGQVEAIYADGELTNFGPLGVTTFVNPNGLSKLGSSYFSATDNSGTPELSAPGGDNGSGFLSTGGLEMSNVDLAREFSNMIVTQRGFQANSRIITTSDSILEELVNLKR